MKMSKLAFAAVATMVSLSAFSGQALAEGDCNKQAAAVAEALKTAKVADDVKAKASALQAEGAAKCKAGDKAAAAKALGDAQALIGAKK